MARLIRVAAAAAVLAIAGCTSGTPGQSPASPAAQQSPAAAGSGVTPAGRIKWHDCNGSGGASRCASLKVPADYQHPSGRKVTLALDEVPATAPAGQRQGALLVNPGGPGASG